MDSFEWNKIAGALLAALFLFVSVGIIAEEIFKDREDPVPSSGEQAANAAETPAVAEGPGFEELLVAAAAGNPGDRAFRKCQACHNVDQDGPSQIGPGLWNIVNAPIGGNADFSYSNAMASKGGTWTYEALDAFLTRPAADIPGTKMSFAGIRRAEERAQVIAYLRNQADNPAPLPDVPAPAAEAESAETGDGS